jgi:hypothetical protein
MAKRRKTARTRKVSSKPARRPRPRRTGKSDEADAMQVLAAVLVIVLIGFAIYFYQVDVKPMQAPMAPPTAMAPSPPPPAAPMAPAAPSPAPTK